MKTKLLLFYLLVTAAVTSSISAKAQATDAKDSLALVDLFTTANGSGWYVHTNWLNGPVRTWYGITVSGKRVVQIKLDNNNLTGSIPSSIGNLDSLNSLDFVGNALTGSIPASIGNLTNLITLDLFVNHLSGSIPSSISKLNRLRALYLNVNQLSGGIPSSITTLTNLDTLTLDYNQLSGNIPPSIGNLINLRVLNLGSNQFTGSIPASIGKLVSLRGLYLQSNQLSGSIPSSIGNLINLQGLFLNNNLLTGTIPSSIGKLKNVTSIFLQYNFLTGQIPPSFFNTLHLDYLLLSHNQLIQRSNFVFPDNTPSLSLIQLDYNNFTFNGLEPIAKKFKKSVYAPQAPISVHQHGNTLAVSAGGTLSNNTYRWYQAGTAGSTTITGDSTFHPTAGGRYYATITNSIATKLTLYTDTITYIAPWPVTATAIVTIYPNPASHILGVTGLNTNSNSIITVADAGGHVWLSKPVVQQSTAQIDISLLKPGYYVLNIKEGAAFTTIKFIKE